MKNKTIWSNRFKNKMSQSFQKIGSSVHIDKRLYEQDIAASVVHTQMLMKQKIIKSEDGLAAVMGHEIAHAVAKHSVERASRGVLLNTGTAILDIATKGAVSNINKTTGMNAVGLLSQIGIMNPFNRKQESEADYLGLIFASLSGYDIRETIKVWERMKEAKKGKEPPEFMSTHPSSTNRINNITNWINEIIIKYPPIV